MEMQGSLNQFSSLLDQINFIHALSNAAAVFLDVQSGP